MKKKGTFSSVLSFANECRWKITLSVLFAIISVAGGLIPYIGAYQIILLFFEESPETKAILLWSGVSAGGYIIKQVFHGISTSLSHVSAYQILESIRMALSEKLMRAPLGSVLSQTAGDFKNIIADRVETIELPLAHMIPEGISNLLLPVCVFVYMLTMDWRIALASLVSIPLGAAAYAVVMRNYNSQYDKFMKASDHVNSVIVEYVEGIQVIKAFNQSNSSYEKYTEAVKSFKDFTLDWFHSTWGWLNLGASILTTTLLGVLPVGILLYTNGVLNPAQVTLAMILSLSIIAPASWFTIAVDYYKSIQYAINDVNRILDYNEIPEEKSLVNLDSYNIELKNVSFAYNETDGNVLENLSLKLPQGRFTALVGPSGGGKSTVARLIVRFWDVSEGEIVIGGQDIRKLPLSQLSHLISYVAQDNFLFNCTLIENIRLGNPGATDEEVFAAAKAACCDEFIGRLENGWNTSAGEAGGRLSGGERQRIAIARAILKNAPIIILDEATAFTDPENEAQLQASIGVLTKGKTLMVIAHRLSTIKGADKIVVIENGQIKAQGTHEALLDESPLYKKMWDAHMGAKQWSATTAEREELCNV